MLLNIKKGMVVLLLFVTAAPVLVITGFLIKQNLIQRRMNEELEKRPLQTITADITEVTWVKQNKEVEVQGRLFDVKQFKISGNKITLTGLWDEDEHALKKELAGLHKQKKDNTAPISQLVLKFLNTATINETFTAGFLYQQNTVQNKYHSYKDDVISRCISVITPPPNV